MLVIEFDIASLDIFYQIGTDEILYKIDREGGYHYCNLYIIPPFGEYRCHKLQLIVSESENEVIETFNQQIIDHTDVTFIKVKSVEVKSKC